MPCSFHSLSIGLSVGILRIGLVQKNGKLQERLYRDFYCPKKFFRLKEIISAAASKRKITKYQVTLHFPEFYQNYKISSSVKNIIH